MSDEIYSRLINYDPVKDMQCRLSVQEFRGVEYLSLRKWYRDFDENWAPTKEGVNIPLTISNSRELFAGLVEIMSLAECQEVLLEQFKDLIQEVFQE